MNQPDLSDPAAVKLIKAHLEAADSEAGKKSLASTGPGQKILAADPDRRAAITAAAIRLWITDGFRDGGAVASALLRGDQKLWNNTRLAMVVETAAELNRTLPAFAGFEWFPHKPLISSVEKVVEREGLSAELRAALEHWKVAVSPRELTPYEERELGEAERVALHGPEDTPWSVLSPAFNTIERLKRIRTPLTSERKLIERLSILLSAPETEENPLTKSAPATVEPPSVASPSPPQTCGGEGRGEEALLSSAIPTHAKRGKPLRIDTTDAVGLRIAADVASGGRASGPAWSQLLQHARALSATKPPRKWMDTAAGHVAGVNAADFGGCVSEWFGTVGKPAPQKIVTFREVPDATLLNDCSVELLQGLAWMIVAARRADLAPALGNLAEACLKKLPGIGPRNIKVGNAAIAALAALEDPQAAAQLTRIRLKAKHPSSRATVDKAFGALSERTGIAPADLAEIAVPTFGLDAKGRRREKLGESVCEIRVVDSQSAGLCWEDDARQPLKSIPALVQKQFGEEVKRLKREAKDISIMLAAQALRLERSYLSDRSWPLETWRERFLNHPLIGTIARRLIWKFETGTAIPVKGQLVDADGASIKPGKKSSVSLWHPIQSKPNQVLAWRKWLERNEITQPFKQAHREIYVLTDAERRTQSCSNRFAGHILRQHIFAALCQQRGWDYRLQGNFDSHSTPTLPLPAPGLTAQFLAEPAGDETSPQEIFLYLASDQVRFGPQLADVPPIIFSEVMRDVDLFVGVSSIGADPTLPNREAAGERRAYWENWSFGELSENARTRKAALETLLPRLADAARFSLKDRYLVVRGDLRTYKIHLGSGNILMEPNDQYLCIVPDRSADAAKKRAGLFLPFEGDPALSVILSKALMLAHDHKIKDQTIVRQIKS